MWLGCVGAEGDWWLVFYRQRCLPVSSRRPTSPESALAVSGLYTGCTASGVAISRDNLVVSTTDYPNLPSAASYARFTFPSVDLMGHLPRSVVSRCVCFLDPEMRTPPLLSPRPVLAGRAGMEWTCGSDSNARHLLIDEASSTPSMG